MLKVFDVKKNKGYPKKLTTDIPISKIVSLSSKNLLQIESNQDIEYDTNQDSLKTDINQSLSCIKIKEKDVIEMFFGLGKYERSYNLEEIAYF